MYIVFDIGGTNTRVAGTTDLESFSEPIVFETPKEFEAFISKFKESALQVAGNDVITAAAGDVAGPFTEDRSTIVQMPSIPEWGRMIPIQQRLSEELEVSVLMMNDAAMVGLGEAVYGAGKDHEIVVYLTVSTGVGGARIVNGQVDERVYGFEPGWQIIDADGTMSPDTNKSGYLIDFVSGLAVEKQTGMKPYEVHDPGFWDKLAGYLAAGLNNTILHWSPHVVVIGGSMMKEVDIKIPDVQRHLEAMMKIYPNLPEIRKAELADFGGLYGAMTYLKQTSQL